MKLRSEYRQIYWIFAGLIVLSLLIAFSPGLPAFAQQMDMDEDYSDVAPAPPSIGADIPLTYFGPAPSEVQRELIGPYKLLKAGQIDLDAGTITLPLYRGQMEDGHNVWYILTDTNDKGNADALGLE